MCFQSLSVPLNYPVLSNLCIFYLLFNTFFVVFYFIKLLEDFFLDLNLHKVLVSGLGSLYMIFGGYHFEFVEALLEGGQFLLLHFKHIFEPFLLFFQALVLFFPVIQLRNQLIQLLDTSFPFISNMFDDFGFSVQLFYLFYRYLLLKCVQIVFELSDFLPQILMIQRVRKLIKPLDQLAFIQLQQLQLLQGTFNFVFVISVSLLRWWSRNRTLFLPIKRLSQHVVDLLGKFSEFASELFILLFKRADAVTLLLQSPIHVFI